MKFGWYSRSKQNSEGKWAILYRAPDGSHGQTLWFPNIRMAASQFAEIKMAWKRIQELEKP